MAYSGRIEVRERSSVQTTERGTVILQEVNDDYVTSKGLVKGNVR